MLNNLSKMVLIDLKANSRKSGFSVLLRQKGAAYVFGKNYFLSGHGPSAFLSFSSLCQKISGRSQNTKFFLSRSVSHNGLCPTDLSGKSPRYRSLSSCPKNKTLSHGHSRQHCQKHSGRCQRQSRLENLCRLCPSPDPSCQTSVSRRQFWSRTRPNCLCPRCHHYRSLPFPFSMGPIPQKKGSHQIAHSFGSTRIHSNVYPHQRRKASRCQYPRSVDGGTGLILHYGQGVPRLHQTPSDYGRFCFLCHPSQIQFESQKNFFSSRRQKNRTPLRSGNPSCQLLCLQGLSRKIAPRQISRCSHRENIHFSDQQLQTAGLDHCTTLQMPMEGRIVFQMDQTTFAYQKILWNFRKRGEGSNLDRCFHLCACGHRKEKTEAGTESLHNFTNFEHHPFREKARGPRVC